MRRIRRDRQKRAGGGPQAVLRVAIESGLRAWTPARPHRLVLKPHGHSVWLPVGEGGTHRRAISNRTE